MGFEYHFMIVLLCHLSEEENSVPVLFTLASCRKMMNT